MYGAFFKSRLLKLATETKCIYLCYRVGTATKTWHAATTKIYTSNDMKISIFLKQKMEIRLKLFSAPLILKEPGVLDPSHSRGGEGRGGERRG